MDFSNLQDKVSNLTLYDLKAGVRKVQNAVMNYTEMESKVRIPTGVPPYSDLRAGQLEDNAIARYAMGQISLLEH
ncbi:epsin-3, clathrin recruitment and traffic between the Golgi and endosome [Penicillium ochrochloron]